MNNYSIGQVSKRVGLPTKTIRFYETQGLVSLPKRLENGYRYYSVATVEELKVLKYARDLGLPLVEIRKLMNGCDQGRCRHSREEILSSIAAYSAQLNAKITQMQILKQRLDSLKNNIDKSDCDPANYCCDLLHQLIDLPREKEGGEDK
jgi:DNA-binding transcriptional MerR regulator